VVSDNAKLNQLLNNMASGDKAAFGDFYRQLEKPVFRFIASKLNDPVEANDILHEVFMDVWRSAAKFEGRSKVRTWVFGIAYRKTMDHFRKYSRVKLTDEMPDLTDDRPDATACLAASQEAAHLRFCLDELKPDHRSVVELAFYEDMTYGQIAEVVGTPEGTIKTRVFHAKKLLLRCLSGRMKRVPS